MPTIPDAITPNVERARCALLNKTGSVFWIGVGRRTAWSDENAPPDPDPTAVAIEEPIVYVRAAFVRLAKTVTIHEDVVHLGQKYAWVADADAITQGARWLYIKAELNPGLDGQPYHAFRQVGIFNNLVPATGHETDDWLAPANGASPGAIVYLCNVIARDLVEGRTEAVPVMREFR